MRRETAPTYWVRLYMSGPIDVAKQTIRRECLREGLCVTIDPTLFIYAGGEEAGFVVGFLEYPRFPVGPERMLDRARGLAEALLADTCQHAYLLETPTVTEWVSIRPDHQAPGR